MLLYLFRITYTPFGIFTYTVQVALYVPDESVTDAVIVVVPALIAVTTPPFTVATLVLLERQVTVASDGYVVAVIVLVAPSLTAVDT